MTDHIKINLHTPETIIDPGATPTVGPFAFNWPFFDLADVQVILEDALEVENLLSPAQYTLTPNTDFDGGYNGGTVTLISTIENTTWPKLIIRRSIPIQRVTDFPTAGQFFIDVLNTELDRIYCILLDFGVKSFAFDEALLAQALFAAWNYDIMASVPFTPVSGEKVLQYAAVRNFDIKADLDLSDAYCFTAPGTTTIFDLKVFRDATSTTEAIGTITFSSGTNRGVLAGVTPYDTANATILAADVLFIECRAPGDSLINNIAFTLRCRRSIVPESF